MSDPRAAVEQAIGSTVHVASEAAAAVDAVMAALHLLDRSAVAAAHPTGPDRGDPAAWGVSIPGEPRLAVFGYPENARDHARLLGGTVVLLDVRAPGAVAAAPPGDEGDDLGERLRIAEKRYAVASGLLGWLRRKYDDGWRLTPPAPPAGHEDEAATDLFDALHADNAEDALRRTDERAAAGWRWVPPAPSAGEDEAPAQLPALDQLGGTGEDEAAVERAARAACLSWHRGIDVWDQDGTQHYSWRAVARAALAAARRAEQQDHPPVPCDAPHHFPSLDPTYPIHCDQPTGHAGDHVNETWYVRWQR